MSAFSNSRSNPAASAPQAPLAWILAQVVIALTIGFIFFLMLVGLTNLAYNHQYRQQIYPGVAIAGVDVSGMTPEQASERLAEQITFPTTGKIVLQDGAKVWIARPVVLGFSLDTAVSGQAAYLVGRQGGLQRRLMDKLQAWYLGVNISSLMFYDGRQARQYLESIAVEIDRPTREASLAVNNLEVVVQPGQVGRKVDIQASLAAVETQLRSLTDGMIPLVIQEDAPAILDAEAQAQAARQVLSAPLVLQLPGEAGSPGPWKIEPARLAEWLVIERVASDGATQYQVRLDEEKLQAYLADLAPSLERQASNARYTFNTETRQLTLLEPSVTGRSLNVEASIKIIQEQILQGKHTIALEQNLAKPQVSDEVKAEDLGIKELVSSYTSYFRGSSSERVQNIKTAAGRFHGLLVPPKSVFSMADAMGDVSLDTGYAEALIILGGRTIKGVGGGVCQVSTTLFRTAFFGGYPIEERHPHAYRVGYYEQTGGGWDANLAGLDATVFVPTVDFKFRNDTDYWILMETYSSAKNATLTWNFYSTYDGRQVDWNTTGPENVVQPPEAVYEENPDLAEGVIKQVDYSAEGADITVTRTVTRGGEELFSDSIITHYLPWRDVYQYGPGTDIPKKKKP